MEGSPCYGFLSIFCVEEEKKIRKPHQNKVGTADRWMLQTGLLHLNERHWRQTDVNKNKAKMYKIASEI